MKWAMIRILFSKPICIYLRYDLLPGTHLYSLLIMGSLELIALEGDIYVKNQQNWHQFQIDETVGRAWERQTLVGMD